MPVSWGKTSPADESRVRGSDIEHYGSFFASYGFDYEMKSIAGLWRVTASVRDRNGTEEIVAQSGLHDTLFEALHACYVLIRGHDSPDPL